MRSFNRRKTNDKNTMHHAVCDQCGRDCEVPFKPSSGKPIYCSKCFENKSDNRNTGRYNRRGNERNSRREDKQMYTVICDSCGKSCEVPFKPNSNKPVYCSKCFETKGNRSSSNNQIDEINRKLDEILSKLNS